MNPSRRGFLAMSGGLAALAVLPLALARAVPQVEVAMRGTARGERVWFTPLGIAVAPSTRIRFVNRDPGNSHTATAYHPANFARSQRVPGAAAPFHSGFLLPGDAFEVVLDAPGVYDYYCLPHERAGMVGRIVVGTPETPGWQGAAAETAHVAVTALAALPSVEQILAHGQVMAEEAA